MGGQPHRMADQVRVGRLTDAERQRPLRITLASHSCVRVHDSPAPGLTGNLPRSSGARHGLTSARAARRRRGGHVALSDPWRSRREIFRCGPRPVPSWAPSELADRSGLTAGLSGALASPRLLLHDRGRVLTDLSCAIADGARVISDFRAMTDQQELFGPVASVPTAWRTLDEIAESGKPARERIAAAVDMARRWAWTRIEARHGAIPGIRIADKVLEGVIGVRLDATVTPAHSDKEGAQPNFKG